jgi:hypothetical protein
MTNNVTLFKKQSAKKIGLTLACAFFIFVGFVLFKTLHPPKQNLIQLSRIDFGGALSNKDAMDVKQIITRISGIQSHYLNQQEGILVFTYNNQKLNSASIFNYFKHSQQHYFGAKPFTISPADCQSGCPMSVSNTALLSKMMRTTQSLF